MSFTKLNAINACLRGIGLAPVATEDSGDLDASTASEVIDLVSQDIQSRGWWFNKEYGWKVTPDITTGYVLVPNNALSAVTIGPSRNHNLTIRDGKLYDTVNHTYDLSDIVYSEPGSSIGYIYLCYILEIDFDNLPSVASIAITYRARREFAQDLEVDQIRWKFQQQDEEQSMMRLLREDARNRKRNALTDNAELVSALSRIAGPNSNYPRIAVFPRRDTY
jgi:hypothetical protein